MKRTVEVLLLN